MRPRLSERDREILRLAVPAFGALVAEPLFLLVDTAIVGTLGTLPLAGLGAAAVVLGTVVGLCIFLAYTTTAVTSRLFGAGDVSTAVSRGVDGMWLALGLGAVLAAAGWLLVSPLLALLGVSADAEPFAATYLRISLLGLPAMLVTLAGTGVLRGLQDTKTPLIVTAIAATSNAGLSALFVLVLDYGIAGSAWGTVIAQTGAGIAYVALIRRAAGGSRTSMRPHLDGMRQSARTGGALFVRTVSLRAVFLLAAAVAARLGDADLAAYQVAMTTWFLLALAHDSLAIAAQAMVGRNLGAGAVAAAHALTRTLARWGLGLGVVLGLLLLAVLPLYVPLFTDDPVVVSALTGALIVVAAQQPLAGPVFVWDGVLIGAGDARWLAGAQTLMFGLFAPAAVAVLVLDANLVALWLALTWFMLVRGLLLWRRVRTDVWAVPGMSR